MSAEALQMKELFGLESYGPSEFYSSLSEVENSVQQAHVHVMRRAWQFLGLNGILCLNGRPTIYFKEVKRANAQRLRDLHRQLWNQGAAPILVVLTSTEVRVFSALAYPAGKDDKPGAEGRLVLTLDRTSQALEARELIRQIETGAIYGQYADSFDPQRNVDVYLLENLRAARDELLDENSGWDHQAVHTLLGRIIFVCYLVDRKIIGERQFADSGAPGVAKLQDLFSQESASAVKRTLARLFKGLQKTFNGSLFTDEEGKRVSSLSGQQINILGQFLHGEKLEANQHTFGFWAYDFSIIPIETISAMYEDFLAAEAPGGKRSSGAYYTRRHLAEFVVDMATEDVKHLHEMKCMDPACGSGIFLVTLFNRMAESWRRENPRARNATRVQALRDLLQDRLCGVDIKETACRITCFSLYLALLDQLNPRDIEELQEKYGAVLPDILALKRKSFRPSGRPVVYEANFFDAEAPIPEDFDIVIGNPPWVSRGQSKDKMASKWCVSDRNPCLDKGPHAQKDREACFMPNKQIVHAFMLKAGLHLLEDGKACLLIPSKAFLNRTNPFQVAWFSNYTVDKVVQLADLSFVLFEDAMCPSTVVRFVRGKTSDEVPFEFLAPKFERDDPRGDVFTIFPEDVKVLRQSEVVAAAEKGQAPVLWKRMLWGTPRDRQLLDHLDSFSRLCEAAGRRKEGKRWLKGQGFQPRVPSTTKPKPTWWEEGHLFTRATNSSIRLVLTPSECEMVGDRFEELHRERDHGLFAPPLVLVSTGFTRAAFCGFPVLFQHALQSIAGPTKDADLLRFLAAYLGSKLAKYYLFHSAANWATERDKVHLDDELMQLPFPFPREQDNRPKAEEIISVVADSLVKLEQRFTENVFGRDEAVIEAYETIDPLVFDYFDLTDRERMLVEDTVSIIEPSSTPPSKNPEKVPIPTLCRPDETARRLYADTLCGVLNDWARKGPWRVRARAEIAEKLGLAVFTLERTTQPEDYCEQNSSDSLESALRRIRGGLHIRKGGLSHILGLKVFDGPCIHVLKSLRLREWLRSAALNDADEIAAAILKPEGD